MSRISVAMAVYNGEKYLKAQINSILVQLFQEDEIIVSYDESNDQTWKIISEYQEHDSRIKVYINNNHGVFENFENAILHCSGDYIFISDQDDLWDAKKRTLLVAAFQKNKADMVIHNGVHINCDGDVISEPFFSMYRIGPGKVKNFIKPRYSGCCTAFTATMAKKILPMPRNVGAYDHWLGTVGEFCGKVCYVDSILIYHRIHGENITPKSRRKLRFILKARMNLVLELVKRLKREKSK